MVLKTARQHHEKLGNTTMLCYLCYWFKSRYTIYKKNRFTVNGLYRDVKLFCLTKITFSIRFTKWLETVLKIVVFIYNLDIQ